MTEEGDETAKAANKLESTLAAMLMLPIALLVPFVYQTSVGFGTSNIVRALFWEYVVSNHYTGFMIARWIGVLDSLLYIAIHFFFVFVMCSFYERRITRAQTVTIGILLELLKIGPSIPMMLTILMEPGPFYVLVLPFPVLLIAGLVMMFVFPPSR